MAQGVHCLHCPCPCPIRLVTALGSATGSPKVADGNVYDALRGLSNFGDIRGITPRRRGVTTQRPPLRACALEACIGMGFPIRGRTFISGPSLPRVCATDGGTRRRCLALVSAARPERTAKRAAGSSFGWPLRSLPAKGIAADSCSALAMQNSFFRGSMVGLRHTVLCRPRRDCRRVRYPRAASACVEQKSPYQHTRGPRSG